MLSIAPLASQAATKTVPPVKKVTYEGKLSSEPVHVQTIAVPGVSVDAAKNAVERAALKRGWEVKSLKNGDIETELVHRTFESTLTFKFSEDAIEVWSVSYNINKNTLDRRKRDEPEGWIRNLHKDVLDLLGLLPK
jgi:hypothetical protein